MNREEALKILINGESEPCYKTCDEDCGKVMICYNRKCKWAEAMDVIREAVKDRPSGEWDTIPNPNYSPFDSTSEVIYMCSQCAYSSGDRITATWHFCPNCGADMRVKNELNRVTKELNSEIEKSKSEIVPDYRDGWRLREGEAE